MQRSDLNPVEEAEAYKALIDRFGRTQDSVAAQVGKGKADGYWQFGVTGQKSRRAPRVLVLQAHGPLLDGTFGEAVQFSNLRIEMNKPYYASAAVRYADKNGPGEVSFTLKDLANDDEPLLHDRVTTSLTGLRTATQPIQLGGKGAGCGVDGSTLTVTMGAAVAEVTMAPWANSCVGS